MRFRWQIVLPFGHLAVDCVILALWVWHAYGLYRPKAELPRPRIASIVLLQEGDGIPFTPEFSSPPPQILFLASGTLPAMLVSSLLRPGAHLLTPQNRWDPVWFVIHEMMCCLVWAGVGRLIDSGLTRIQVPMGAYLAARFGGSAFSPIDRVADVGWRVEVLVWMVLVVYLTGKPLRGAFPKAVRRS
jgi:hypothetical protein